MSDKNYVIPWFFYLEQIELGMKGSIGYGKSSLHLDRDSGNLITATLGTMVLVCQIQVSLKMGRIVPCLYNLFNKIA